MSMREVSIIWCLFPSPCGSSSDKIDRRPVSSTQRIRVLTLVTVRGRFLPMSGSFLFIKYCVRNSSENLFLFPLFPRSQSFHWTSLALVPLLFQQGQFSAFEQSCLNGQRLFDFLLLFCWSMFILRQSGQKKERERERAINISYDFFRWWPAIIEAPSCHTSLS